MKKRGTKRKDELLTINEKKKGAIKAIDKKIKDLAKEVKAKEQDVDNATSQLLQDLRWAYRNSVSSDGKKGRQRLMELMKNDADFKFAMKELMRIEAAIASTKVRMREDQDVGTTTFVILKGLADPVKEAEKSDVLDLVQIADAFNPNAETKIPYEPEFDGPVPGK